MNDDKFFTPQRLPSETYEQSRRMLVLPSESGDGLRRFGGLVSYAQEHRATNGPLNGFLILEGPAGCGKTLTAQSLAQALAIRHKKVCGKDTFAFPLQMPAFFSERLGASAKAVRHAFEMITFSAERRPTIVLADEIEAITYSRARISSSDPTDVIRAGDELLRQMDSLRGNPNFLLIATTNVYDLLDEAIVDRADYVVHYVNPDVRTGRAILFQAARRARQVGIFAEEAELRRAAEGLCNNGSDCRPSGRLLSKLVLLSYTHGNTARPSASDMIEVAKRMMNSKKVSV